MCIQNLKYMKSRLKNIRFQAIIMHIGIVHTNIVLDNIAKYFLTICLNQIYNNKIY